MENTYIQQLDYTAQTSQNIPAKRKILDYYAKLDHEKERKTKCELFTIQNIQGLLSVIQINSNKLQFLSFEELCSQLTLFLQNAKRIQCRNKDLVKISEQKFIILLDGIIMKKTDLLSLTINQMMITQTIFKNRNSGLVTKQKQKKFPSALNNNTMPIKRPNVRKIVTNEHLSPIPIHFNFLDNKEFQCCSSVIYLEFPLISLETFQNRIDLKEKQCLAHFIQVCLGVQSKKTFLRVVPKLQRVNICCNRQFFGAFKTIYMIYKGEIVLQSEKYQISLNKNGVVYKQEGAPFKMVSKNPQTLIFSIQMGEIIQIFKEVNSETLQYIMLNLKNLDQKRQGLLQRLQTKTEDQQLIEPIFDTQVLNFKYFEKRNQYNESKEDLKKNRKYFIPKSACQAKSSRMRHHQQNQKQNTLQSDLSIFLSNYPYVKIVQSEIKAHQILKTGVNERSMQRKMAAYQKFTDEQKKKVQKDRKKFYYMDKVRRMKIKNIAEREIPNGHKKNFKMDEAEKQISQYTLFKNIIEYPMNGVSQNATKSSKNKKKIQKLVRMCTVSSKIQRRTSGNQIKSFENIDIKYETNNQLDLDSLQSQRGNSRDEQNQSNHIKQKLSPQESQFKKEFTTGNSFYWTNILNPHLPTQKQMKIKRKRLSSNKIEVELQNDNFWEQKQNPRKDLSRKKYRQMKQKKSPNNLSFQRSYKRIKTTLH